MRPTLRALLVAGVAALTAATLASPENTLPSLGSAGGGSLSSADEYQIGLQIMREIRNSGALFDDPLVTDYLQGLGQRLAASSDDPEHPFKFFMVADSSINAFALPGGFIGVNAGLMMLTQDEAELAGVMAHEVAHVTQRHIARRVEASKGMSLVGLAAILGAIAIASSGVSSDTAQAAIFGSQALMQQQQINFTRANEYEADRVGIQILADAGFDPEGMVSFFEKMQRESRYAESRRFEFLSTHPLSTSRITEARIRAKRAEVAQVPESRLYPLMMARLRALGADEPRTALDAEEKRKVQDDATRYARALLLGRLDRHADAIVLLTALVAKDQTLVAYHLALAEALAAAERHDEANAAYQRAQRLFPTSVALTLSHAEWLIQRGRPAQAHEEVIDLLTRVPSEPRHYLLLARAAAEAGSTADSRYYNAERFLLEGDLLAAMDQLKLALSTPNLSEFQRARYQARYDRLLGILSTMSREQRQALERSRG
jgi:predicted Zn-dependent protease